ncbi:MAG TPA: NAD-binding protein, partial [Acidimicrobiia bacterium]
MHIVIAGVGRVGSELARRTSLDGHDVVAIDKHVSAFDRLGSEFNGETVTGEAFDVS